MSKELNIEFLSYSYLLFAHAKEFAFRKWVELAFERDMPQPEDLSGACKFGSLFMQNVFGGEIEGHYEHQFNRINGRIVDLSHDARDVGHMRNPYLHEPEFFVIPEQLAVQAACLPRAILWGKDFALEVECRRILDEQRSLAKP